ncbi:NADPH-dependent FMN reductase [Actinomadura rupiterrae]|uniref:NADPH-dependent FMN reductase n=1 Tax=Actinomadura rupiterrae TaxID=559627 RepID=UPI0020A434C6|nr:NAD(P)H-dependent oxidoreductase [Actinomadura rupiterrae]MCP2340729.1 NAD(P)H-dependent FMN reductase [Actinomadura rupiterrae]
MSETASPPQPPLRLAVIIGSTRRGRFGPTIADWFTAVARTRDDLETEVIDLADVQPPEAPGTASSAADAAPAAAASGVPSAAEAIQAFAAASEALERADAFVIVTPEYNHSFPGGLKDFIDAHLRQWQAKPVAFVSYGGMSGGLRAVEHLRQVFAELHATTVRNVVSVHNPWTTFDAECPDARAAAHRMLDQLGWWGSALRDARAVRPYEEV